MILTEQQYKNLNRRYFHGSQNGRLNQKEGRQNFLHLSNSFVYSSMYACQIGPLQGKVFEFRLKEGLNIFNAKCKNDLLKLKIYARKNNIDWEKLEKEDWSLLKSKGSIIELIRGLGFDGFFDWEWTDNLRNYRKEVEGELKGQFLDECLKFGVSKNGKYELTEELQVRPVDNKLKEQFGKNYENFYREYRKLNRELHVKF